MNVAATIQMLKAAITALEQQDPNKEVVGMIRLTEGGYGGDLERPITKIEMEPAGDDPTDGVVVAIYN